MVLITRNGNYNNLHLRPYVDRKTNEVSPGLKHGETITLQFAESSGSREGTSQYGKAWRMHNFKVLLGEELVSMSTFDEKEAEFLNSLQAGDNFTVTMTKETYIATKGPQKGQEKLSSNLAFTKA